MRIAFLLALLLMAPASAEAFRVGVSANSPPASFVADEVSGYGPDLMSIGALKTGIDIEFVPFDDLADGVAMLRNGTLDAVGTMAARPDLLEFAEMETPWAWAPVVLMTHGGHDWTRIEDAEGTISTIKGSPLEAILQERFAHMTYVETANPGEGAKMLANQSLDAYVGPLAIVGYQIQQFQLEGLRPIGDALRVVEAGFWAATPEAKETLATIRGAITEEEARVIYVKWTGFDLRNPERETSLPGWVVPAALASVAAVVISLVFIAILRARVRAATMDLRALNEELEHRVAEQTQEIRRVAARLQTLFSANPVGLMVATSNGELESVNDALCHLLGYQEDELLDGDLRAVDLWEELDYAAVVQTLQTGGVVRDELVQLVGKDGSKKHASVTFDLLDVEGETRILGTAMDVTDRENARETQLANAKIQLELESARKMESFARDLINRTAHEVATPLTPMMLAVNLLVKSKTTENAESVDLLERNLAGLKEALDELMQASARMGQAG